MKKATRRFLSDKQSVSNLCKFVNVHKMVVENAKPNHCKENATDLCRSDKKYILQSGWLIGDYFGDNGTAIIPHYWVLDSDTNISYEVTPTTDTQTFEYVLDLEIIKHSSKNALVPPCLKLLNGGIYLIKLDHEHFIPTNSIDTQHLYQRFYEYESELRTLCSATKEDREVNAA